MARPKNHIDALLESSESAKLKQVFVKKQPDDYNEITLNTGGISSTLQDVKPQKRSGGYAYMRVPNRIIHWKSEHNVLEMREDSLDFNLRGNQVRYTFTDSPVLEGISITETDTSVIILVPTVSSLHKFTYDHPKKEKNLGNMELYESQDADEESSLSIFHAADDAQANDPGSYYILNTPSCRIICGASALSLNDNAIFSLSLANGSILFVELLSTGETNVKTFNQDSLVPRLFSGITDVLMRKETDNVAVSMEIIYVENDLYIFTLDRLGVLKAWSCYNGSVTATLTLIDKDEALELNKEKHKLCYGYSDDNIIIYCYLQGHKLYSIGVAPENGNVNLDIENSTNVPTSMELISMALTDENDIWCNWVSDEEIPSVARYENGAWEPVALAHPPLEVQPKQLLKVDYSTLYLDALFTCGFFTASDISKALSLYKSTTEIKQNVDVREQICSVVESEIYTEVGDNEIDDDQYLEISERCWSRLYNCCCQFVMNEMFPRSLVWLNGIMVLVQDSGFSLVTELDPIELAWRSCYKDDFTTNLVPSFQYNSLLKQSLEKNACEDLEKIDLTLHLGLDLNEYLCKSFKENTHEMYDPCYSTSFLGPFDEPIKEVKWFRELIAELTPPHCLPSDFKALCSHSGLSAITTCFKDYSYLRYLICKHLLLFLNRIILGDEGESIKHILIDYCKCYHLLYWTCIEMVNADTPIIYGFILSKMGSLVCETLADSVKMIASTLWPKEGNLVLVEYLFESKLCLQLELLKNLVDWKPWVSYLIESFLAMGQSRMAFEYTCKYGMTDIKKAMKYVRLFESYQQTGYAIALSEITLSMEQLAAPDEEILQSILFVHELQLRHYEKSYKWLMACKEGSRQTAFLHRFLTTMIADKQFKKLCNFKFCGLQRDVENLLLKRARSLPFQQAKTYYSLLYSFSMNQGKIKSAATVMYEKGLRSDSCELQWKCFLMTLNNLELCQSDEKWIFKPNLSQNQPTLVDDNDMEILHIDTIRRKYEVSGARYNLSRCPLDSTEEEVISICIEDQQYRIALRLAKICKLPFAPIIKRFTASCANLNSDNWEWLRQNEIDDFFLSEYNYKDVSWWILKRLIEVYEEPYSTELLEAAAIQLIEMGNFLPCWLTSVYCKKNPAGLLRLYYKYGLLEEASSLGCEYLKAAMGIGMESFGFKTPMILNSPPLALPLNLFDLIVRELKEHKLEIPLENTLNEYIQLAVRISNDISY